MDFSARCSGVNIFFYAVEVCEAINLLVTLMKLLAQREGIDEICCESSLTWGSICHGI